MKDLRQLIFVPILLSVCIAMITVVTNGFSLDHILTLKWWGINFLYSFVLFYINTVYFKLINHRLQWNINGIPSLIIGSIGSILITIIAFAFCQFIVTVIILENQTYTSFIASQSFSRYLFPLLITTILSLLFFSIYFYKATQENKIAEQKIIAGTASAKFEALKNQLDPHFLFNSLNVLTSLIEENPRVAQKFATSLSKVYRYVLEQKNKELVTVDEELKFAKTYMTLLKLRFENSIVFDLPEQAIDPEAKVVPLSLQILLENTIKHNIVMPEKPLHIKIYEKNGFLYVENNLQPKAVLVQKSGVGLSNIKQRYALLTKKEFSVFKTDSYFIAKLPVVTKLITGVKSSNLHAMKNTSSSSYKRAIERVKKVKSFYTNIIIYCIVISFTAYLNYLTNDLSIPWFLFPATGWGIGLFFHSMDTFNYHPILGKDWEKRKIKEFMLDSKKKYD